MAKINKVRVQDIPEYVGVSKQRTNTLKVITEIIFHPLDVKLEMEYQLYLFVYDIHGKEDIPILITNWDDSKMERVSKEGHRDDFLSKGRFLIKSKDCQNNQLIVEKQMTIKLGERTKTTSVYTRNFEVLATLIPAINKASARSSVFESTLVFP